MKSYCLTLLIVSGAALLAGVLTRLVGAPEPLQGKLGVCQLMVLFALGITVPISIIASVLQARDKDQIASRWALLAAAIPVLLLLLMILSNSPGWEGLMGI